MKSGMLDLFFIDETHLRKENNVDLSAFAAWTPIFLENGWWQNDSTLREYGRFGMESKCRGKRMGLK